jgi:hypothetical protein
MNFLLLALLISRAAFAGDTNVLAGQYSDCTQWTAMDGVPTSKAFTLTFGEDDSLDLAASLYEGSNTCQGAAKEVRNYQNMAILEDSGNHPVRVITALDRVANLYFKLVLSKDSAIIYTGDSMPVKADSTRVMVLTRSK